MSRRLILLRHAKSDWPNGVSDHERPLSARGLADAPRIGDYIESNGLISDLTIISTARRTRETWELLQSRISNASKAQFDDRVYEAKPSTLFYVIQETAPMVECLMLIGHNPGLEELAQLLIGNGDPKSRQLLSCKYPTGGLVVIDFDIHNWEDIMPKSGNINRFVIPKDLII